MFSKPNGCRRAEQPEWKEHFILGFNVTSQNTKQMITFKDGLHWRRSAIFVSVSPFVATLIARMPYQGADDALVTMGAQQRRAWSGNQGWRTAGGYYRRTMTYKFTLSMKQSSNGRPAADLQISSWPLTPISLSIVKCGKNNWRHVSPKGSLTNMHVYFSRSLFQTTICKYESTFHSCLKHYLTALLSVSSSPLTTFIV